MKLVKNLVYQNNMGQTILSVLSHDQNLQEVSIYF